MRKVLAATMFAALLASSAEVSAQSKATPQGERACRGDVARLCRAMQDEAAVLNCLVSNKEKLSKPCQSILTANGH